MSDLERAFRKAMYYSIDNRGRSGTLGKDDGTIIFTDDNGNEYRNKVWVKIITDAGVSLVVAENSGVPLQPRLPVRVQSINGVLTVTGTDVKKANIYTGGYIASVAEHAWTHGRFGPDPVYITGGQFLPLMATPSNPAAMTVTVIEGWYRWENSINVWDTAASSSLSGYVPATSGTQHFVVLSLDRSSNTLAITDGISTTTPLVTTVPFTNAQILSVIESLDIRYYPIAAIRFYYGQTTIKAPDIWKDLRLWGGESGYGTYTGVSNSDDAVVTESVTVNLVDLISASDDVTIDEAVTVTVV